MTDSTHFSSGSQHSAESLSGGAYPPPPPYHPSQPLAEPGGPRPRRSRRSVALVAAVALASGLIGGGAAVLIGNATRTDTVSSSVVGSPTSAKSLGSVSAVASAVSPSIVEITANTGSGQSIGSGVVLGSDGTILTNNHVIAGADTVKVNFTNGKSASAKVIATDASKDLAVIKAQGVSGLPTATLGNSDSLAVGDQVVAIGSPEGLSNTVTSGVVSALNRDVTVPVEGGDSSGGDSGNGNGFGGWGRGGGQQWPFEFGGGQYNGQVGGNTTTYKAIQTDAPLNPGNSGGALINLSGQVVAINSAMYSPSSGSGSSSSDAGSIGLGFAIPINTVKSFLNSNHISYNS
ncbi:S1C family serine protease [Streptomyces silvisoli]|uniref:Trypsin-like peptidase domain-containing protein n=1 Tax=Streptomyces silvisoli TaxID=3034235 RepID=A0ABT5ZSD7_9ACTN|nr:trypsin-like peptidase domain-containing protein [Streptomyces silvisoli]MDF3292754.1 trypsin-like peptidase domain-containing protein [Streptomyces silvisoli]